jgi:hypothetical protein
MPNYINVSLKCWAYYSILWESRHSLVCCSLSRNMKSGESCNIVGSPWTISKYVFFSPQLSLLFHVPKNNFITYCVLLNNMFDSLVYVAYCSSSCFCVRTGCWFSVCFLLWLPVCLLFETHSRTLQGRCNVCKQRWRKIKFQSLKRFNFYTCPYLLIVLRLRMIEAINLLLP